MIKSNHFVIVVSLVLVVSLLFLSFPFIKNYISVDGLELKGTTFTCEESSCVYSAVVSNNTKEVFTGFFHIYGYTKNDGSPLIIF